MGLSFNQKEILHKLAQGARLIIARSPFDKRPIYALLIDQDGFDSPQLIPWWRIQKLMRGGKIRANAADIDASVELLRTGID